MVQWNPHATLDRIEPLIDTPASGTAGALNDLWQFTRQTTFELGFALIIRGLHLQRHPNAKQFEPLSQSAAGQVAEGQPGGSLSPLGFEHGQRVVEA